MLALCILSFSICGECAFCQNKTKIQDGLYVVNYAGTYVIEDDINQCSISIDITQERIDDRNNEIMYNVVCGKWTRRVTKFALKSAVAAGIKASGVTGGTSLMVSAAAELASWIYDDACEYWGKKNNEHRNRYNN